MEHIHFGEERGSAQIFQIHGLQNLKNCNRKQKQECGLLPGVHHQKERATNCYRFIGKMILPIFDSKYATNIFNTIDLINSD